MKHAPEDDAVRLDRVAESDRPVGEVLHATDPRIGERRDDGEVGDDAERRLVGERAVDLRGHRLRRIRRQPGRLPVLRLAVDRFRIRSHDGQDRQGSHRNALGRFSERTAARREQADRGDDQGEPGQRLAEPEPERPARDGHRPGGARKTTRVSHRA